MVYIDIKDDKNTYEQRSNPLEGEIDIDCCNAAREAFQNNVKDSIENLGTARQREILPQLLTINQLSCEHFLDFLQKLNKISGSGNVVSGITSITNRYIRLDKVPTSMMSVVANIIKSAASVALSDWMECSKRNQSHNYNTNDATWQSTLLASEDLRFQTWDNTLKWERKKIPPKPKATDRIIEYLKNVPKAKAINIQRDLNLHMRLPRLKKFLNEHPDVEMEREYYGSHGQSSVYYKYIGDN